MKNILFLIFCFMGAYIPSYAQGWSELGTGTAALHPNADISTTCIDRFGNVYAAGGLDTALYVVKWNGTSWMELGSGSTSPVSLFGEIATMVADSAGNIYVGGAPYSTPGTPPIHTVMKWDGTSWSDVGSGTGALVLNAEVLTLCMDRSGNLYAAGVFENSTGHTYVAKWDGTSWTELGTGTSSLKGNSEIDVIYTDAAGNLYAGGGFTDGAVDTIGNIYVAKWDGASWSELGPGICHGYGEYYIYSITGDPAGNIYAAGKFADANGYYVAKWDGSMWSELGTGAGILSANDLITSMCWDNVGNLYATGFFTDSVSFLSGHEYVAKWNGSTWSELGTGSSALNANDWIFSVCSDVAGNIYAAGDFKDAAGYPYVAKYPSATEGITSLHHTSEINLYPNPATNEITIASPGKITFVSITNPLGQTVFTHNYNKEPVQMDISYLSAGVYFVRINESEVRRFVKE